MNALPFTEALVDALIRRAVHPPPETVEKLRELARTTQTIIMSIAAVQRWLDKRFIYSAPRMAQLQRAHEMHVDVNSDLCIVYAPRFTLYKYKNGDKEWLSWGWRHRDYGPAVERADGRMEWWVYGKRHRDGGKPAIETPNGYREWWVCGNLHREGAPAIETPDGYREWWFHGVRMAHTPRIWPNE